MDEGLKGLIMDTASQAAGYYDDDDEEEEEEEDIGVLYESNALELNFSTRPV